MSQSLIFLDQDRNIVVTFKKKRYPNQSYTQSFMNIKVQGPSDSPSYEVDLDDNTCFSYFNSLSELFSYLRTMKKKQEEIARLTDSSTLSFIVKNRQGELQGQEPISLNRIQSATEQELLQVVQRVDFYNNVFKTKMIQKIEKVVRKHFTAKEEKLTARSEKKEDKKIKLINSNSELIFTLNLENHQHQYVLNQNNPFKTFTTNFDKLERGEFAIKVHKIRVDRVMIGVRCLKQAQMERNYPIRVCQFSRNQSNGICIEDGQEIHIYLEQGGIVVKNAITNDGKMFDNLYQINDDGWKCQVTVNLLDF